MAIARTVAPIGAVSGRLGSLVAVNTRGGLVLRPRPLTVAHDTPWTEKTRTMPYATAKAWRALSSALRQAWKAAAANVPRVNRLGMQRPLTGWQFYTMVSFTLYAGRPPANLAPPTALFNYPPVLNLPTMLSNGAFAVTTYGAAGVAGAVTAYAYLIPRTRTHQDNAWTNAKYLGSKVITDTTTLWTSELAARYAALPSGQPYALGIRLSVAGGLPSNFWWTSDTVDGGPWTIENFESGSLAAYTGDTAPYSLTNSPTYSGAYALKYHYTAGGTVPTHRLYAGRPGQRTGAKTLPMDARIQVDGNTSFAVVAFNGNSTYNVLAAGLRNNCTQHCVLRYLVGGGAILVQSGVLSIPTGEWLRITYYRDAANLITSKLYKADGTLLSTISVTDSTVCPTGIGFITGPKASTTSNVYFDDVRILNAAP